MSSEIYRYSLELIENEPGQSQRFRYKAKILSTIYQNPGITRKEISSHLGIRAGTITDIVQVLVNDGIIIESPTSEPKERGRPEIPLNVNHDRWYAIAIYCVSLNLCGVLLDGQDNEIARKTVRIPATSDNSDFETAIIDLVGKVLDEHDRKKPLLGVSLSVPGIVDSVERKWIFSARWPRLRQFSLAGISEKINVPININRQLDVQLGCSLIKDPDLRRGNVLLFHWGYGIGGAYSTNGSILRSSSGVFCQIGHVSINPASTKPCICGRLGCLEADAALWALAPEIERTHGKKLEDEVDSRNFIASHPIVNEEYFRQALNSVAQALSHLQAVLVPDVILTYGSFLENDAIFESLVAKTEQLSPPFIAERIHFRRIEMEELWDPQGITADLYKNAIEEAFSNEKPSTSKKGR